MRESPRVSIVVPIYNVEKYLSECIDSIISQTHSNLEIILVNDGSTDGCADLCDEYAKKDNRIKVIHKKNGGLSDARNKGLELSTSDYISFVDSDDYIDQNYVKNLLRSLIDTDADISCCGYYPAYDNGRLVKRNLKSSKIFTGVEAIANILTPDNVCEVSACNKLYRRSLFVDNNILYPEGKINEDLFVIYRLFYYSKSVSYINEPLYLYRQRSGSIMRSKFNMKRFDALEALDEAEQFFNTNGLVLHDELQYRRLLTVVGLYNSYLASGYVDYMIEERLKCAAASVGGIYLNTLISFKHRSGFMLIKASPWLYSKLLKLKLKLSKYLTRVRRDANS